MITFVGKNELVVLLCFVTWYGLFAYPFDVIGNRKEGNGQESIQLPTSSVQDTKGKERRLFSVILAIPGHYTLNSANSCAVTGPKI